MKKNKVYLVIVTYKPDKKTLNECINSLISQVDKILLIDNTPIQEKNFLLNNFNINSNKVEIVSLGDNYGIAYAQNLGIRKALQEGADFVLFSDQDTVYPDNYIFKMLECYFEISKNKKVAAVAPMFRDIYTMKVRPMVYFKYIFLKKEYNPKNCLSVSHVISSGMLVSRNIFGDVGLMREDFFIDWVDTEWCWRALMLGYDIIQNNKVVINHQHGNDTKKILWREFTIHNSIRNYYRLRNATYMLLYCNLNLSMKINLLKRIIAMVLIHFSFGENKKDEIKNIMSALKDGIFKKLGKKFL
jgi:rhamnosyltransferase